MTLGVEGFAMRIRLGLIFLVVLGLSALTSCSSDDSTPVVPTTSGNSGSIEYISDQIVVFTGPGEAFHLSAVVRDDSGNVNTSAQVTWSSLDPSIATVSADGTVTSVGDFGSTLVAASFGDLTPAVANVVIAELTPLARLIHSDDVISVSNDQTQVVLAANDNTTGISSGNVVMSGDKGGVLVRVISVQASAGEITLTSEPAVLTEFYHRLSIDISSPMVNYSDDFQQEEKAPPFSIICEPVQGQLDVNLTGFRVRPKFDLGFSLKYTVVPDAVDPNKGRTTDWQMLLTGELGLKINLGTARLGGRGVKECKAKGPRIPIIRVPLGGVVVLGADVTPIWGVIGELEIEAVELSIPGAGYEKSYYVVAGLGWSAVGGLETIVDWVPAGPGMTAPKNWAEAPFRLKGKAEAYLGIVEGFKASLGPFDIIELDYARVRGTAGLGFQFEPPLYGDPDWLGTRKDLYLGLSADLNPLLKEINLLNRVLEKIGAPKIVNFDPKLLDSKVPFASIEPPALALSTTSVSDSSPTVDLTATITPTMTFLGVKQVKFLFYDPADLSAGGQIIGVASIDPANNQASFNWNAYSAIQGLSTQSQSLLVKATTGSIPSFFAMGSKPMAITSGCSPAGPAYIEMSIEGGITGSLILHGDYEVVVDTPTLTTLRHFGPGEFGPQTVCGETFLLFSYDVDIGLTDISLTSALTGQDGTVINMLSTSFEIIDPDIALIAVTGTWVIEGGPNAGLTGSFRWETQIG
jgi:hypothetical protein